MAILLRSSFLHVAVTWWFCRVLLLDWLRFTVSAATCLVFYEFFRVAVLKVELLSLCPVYCTLCY